MEEVKLVEREEVVEKIQDEDVEVVAGVERERYLEERQMEEINIPEKPSLAYYKNEVMKLLERVNSAEKTIQNLKNSYVFNGKPLFYDLFNPLATYETVR